MHQNTARPSQDRGLKSQQESQSTSRILAEPVLRSPGGSDNSHSSWELSYIQSSVEADEPTSPMPGAELRTNTGPSSTEARDLELDKPRSIPPGEGLRWEKIWRIPVTIIGFYLLALLCALAHYCFFVYLNNRIVSEDHISSKTTTIPQAYVTTISLLLVTAVRASLVASVATCYTQMLWATLRQLLLKISLIEDLFQVQTDPLRFANHNIYRKTPQLAGVAAFCWLIPIAAVYPPGALIVTSQTSTLDTSFNVSVLHQKSPLDMQKHPSIAHIMCRGSDGSSWYTPSFPDAAQNASLQKGCRHMVSDYEPRINYITRSSLITGEIARMNHPTVQNSSYSLEYWGITLDCVTKDRDIERRLVDSDIAIDDKNNLRWEITAAGELSIRNDPDLLFQNTTITHRIIRTKATHRYYPCLADPLRKSITINSFPLGSINSLYPEIRVLIPITETTCHPKLVKYNIIISHSGGAQNVSFTIRDGGSIPEDSSEFDDFDGTFQQFVQFSNVVALYADFAKNLGRSPTTFSGNIFAHPYNSQTTQPYTLENGTIVQACQLNSQTGLQLARKIEPSDIWPLSVFERRLRTFRSYAAPMFDSGMVRELLANTTISALSYSERFDIVDGIETRNCNIYRFEHKLAFFLPYSLSLGLAIPIIALGLIALYVQNNGVSAISGGFVQLLMTTTGRTGIESAIMKDSATLGGHENFSNELQDMEIRFEN